MRRLLYSSVIVVTLLLGVVITVQLYDHVQINKIMKQKDMSLVSYDYAKSLATDTLQLLTIDNQNDYDVARAKYRKFLSDELWDSYFSTEKYTGEDKNFTIKRTGIVGSLEEDGTYVFKINFTITTDKQEKQSAILVYIKNNIVYKTQSLG